MASTEVRQYLSYSKPDQVLDDGRSRLTHWYSRQYKRLHPGDIVWLITMEEGRLYTIGAIEIGGVYSPEELIAAESAWEGDEGCYGIFADRDRACLSAQTDLTELAPRLRFVSTNRDRLPDEFRPEHFQTMRRLTDESAALIEAAWRQEAALRGLLEDEHQSDAELELETVAAGETDGMDADRVTVLRAIVQRRGQAEFREDLLLAYDDRCAMSDCSEVAVLEAAHIEPFAHGGSFEVTNGLLLRADLHTLFDLFLISVDPASLTNQIADAITDPSYRALHGRSLRVPDSSTEKPDQIALSEHFEEYLRRQG